MGKKTGKSFFTKLLSILLISSLGILVYSNSFRCSFQYDDAPFIIRNVVIRNIYKLQDIWHYYHGRFITFLSLAFNYHFNGLNVFGYHLFNLMVHLISAILVWWLTLLTFSTPAMKENKITNHANSISLLVGLVFVSHPVQTEAVTYIWQRAASMAALFYLASVCFYVKSRLQQDNEPGSGPGRFYYMCSLITAVVAMFTKENAVTLPFMILIYELTFLKTKRRLDWNFISPFLLTIFIIPITFLFIKSQTFQSMYGDLVLSTGVITPMHYFLTQLRAMFTYIRLSFFPCHQNIDYDYLIFKNIFELPVFVSFLFLISIFYWTKCLFSKYRLVAFSIFWFFLTIIPESSFWAMRDMIFEHRLYLPLAGFSMFLVSSMYYLWENNIKMMVIVLLLIIACYSHLAYQRNEVWKNEYTLWDDAVQKSPHKVRPYVNRGAVYAQFGYLNQAMDDFNKAIALDPKGNLAQPYTGLGLIYERQGKLLAALIKYSQAIIVDPDYAFAYYHRGQIYEKLHNLPKAISDYNNAIEHDSENSVLYFNPADLYYKRGNIYANCGKFKLALMDYTKAIDIDPNFAAAYNKRNIIYLHFKKNNTIGDLKKASGKGN